MSLAFERAHKLILGFLLSHFDRFLQPSLQAVDLISQPIIEIVATMGLAPSTPAIVQLNQQLTYVDTYGEVVVRPAIKKPQ